MKMKDYFEITIRPTTPDDNEWLQCKVSDELGGFPVITPGDIYQPEDLSGIIAVGNDQRIGLLNYVVRNRACEIVTLASLHSGMGIGTALIDEAITIARQHNCERLWLVTTNDNLNALGFYQTRGFRLTAIHRNAMDRVRQLKPDVPRIGLAGIPLRDMIELEMWLEPGSSATASRED